MRTAFLSVGVAALFFAAFAACGSGGSEFPEPDGSSGNNSNGGNNTSSGGIVENDAGNYTPFDPDECATTTLEGRLLPVELALVFDNSSSMCYVEAERQFLCDDNRSRWPATTSALRTFLTSPDSQGLSMAVRTYGPVDGYQPPAVATNRCNPALYETPDIAAQDLPSDAFANQVLALRPDISHPDATQTQTGAAIGGGAVYSRNREAQLGGEKRVSILLITDGNPAGCGTNPKSQSQADVDAAVNAARDAKNQGTEVYVLNIGGEASVLNAIAAAGGTGEAINIADATNANEIIDALNRVRGQALSCNFQVPIPEIGEPDPEKLNILWTPTPDSEYQVIYRSADCSDGRGWKYDNPDNPTSVTLCPELCNEVMASDVGKIDVVLGCATRGGPPR